MDYVLVAGAFPFIDQATADPPDKRMEPENGFNEHVEGGGEIVAAADMTEFVV